MKMDAAERAELEKDRRNRACRQFRQDVEAKLSVAMSKSPFRDQLVRHIVEQFEAALSRDEVFGGKDSLGCQMPGRALTPEEQGWAETIAARGLSLEVLAIAYDWTYDTDGEIHGLVAGDQGFEPTGIKVDDIKKYLLRKEER